MKFNKFRIPEKATKKSWISAEDLWKSLKELVHADQESMWLIGYNGHNVEIYRECIFIGGMDFAAVDFKIIFKRLLEHNCHCFSIVHNHPGVSAEPSEDDENVTYDLETIAKIFQMDFMDHVIIGIDSYYSFKRKSLHYYDNHDEITSKRLLKEGRCKDLLYG